jgi:hypothetical protein
LIQLERRLIYPVKPRVDRRSRPRDVDRLMLFQDGLEIVGRLVNRAGGLLHLADVARLMQLRGHGSVQNAGDAQHAQRAE